MADSASSPLFDGSGTYDRSAASRLVAVRYAGTGLEWLVTLGQNDIGVVRGRGQRYVAVCPRFLAGPGTTRRAAVSRCGGRTVRVRFSGRRARPIRGRARQSTVMACTAPRVTVVDRTRRAGRGQLS